MCTEGSSRILNAECAWIQVAVTQKSSSQGSMYLALDLCDRKAYLKDGFAESHSSCNPWMCKNCQLYITVIGPRTPDGHASALDHRLQLLYCLRKASHTHEC